MPCIPLVVRRMKRTAPILALGLTGLLLGGCDSFGGGAPSVYESEEGAREALKRQGAKLENRFYAQGVAWSVDLSGVNVTDETVELLKKIGHVSELNFRGSTVTDKQLAAIDEFSGVVQTIDLRETKITDAGVGAMRHFNTLRELKLTGTPVTNAGIAQFQKNRQGTDTIKIVTKKVKIVR